MAVEGEVEGGKCEEKNAYLPLTVLDSFLDGFYFRFVHGGTLHTIEHPRKFP